MVKPTKIIASCTGFEWDSGNNRKNCHKHNVSTLECEQIFYNKPLIVKRDKDHSASENRCYALGRTDLERLLFVVFTIRNGKIRVISARDMTAYEVERYLK